LTQVIDAKDAVLGFVPRWVEGLARRCERVRVVALEAGDTGALPANVDVRVVGRKGVLVRWLRYRRILREALGKDGFDAVLARAVDKVFTASTAVELVPFAGVAGSPKQEPLTNPHDALECIVRIPEPGGQRWERSSRGGRSPG
jgi:hypothetical protein